MLEANTLLDQRNKIVSTAVSCGLRFSLRSASCYSSCTTLTLTDTIQFFWFTSPVLQEGWRQKKVPVFQNSSIEFHINPHLKMQRENGIFLSPMIKLVSQGLWVLQGWSRVKNLAESFFLWKQLGIYSHQIRLEVGEYGMSIKYFTVGSLLAGIFSKRWNIVRLLKVQKPGNMMWINHGRVRIAWAIKNVIDQSFLISALLSLWNE